MAVGQTGTDNSARHTLLAERWNGTKWSIVPVPNPPGITPAGGNLESVSCSPAGPCMAVGTYWDRAGQAQPLAELWNGSRWKVVPIPSLPGAHTTFLNSVACTAASACTAVAAVNTAASTWVTLAERWDGTGWRIQPTPTPPAPPNATGGCGFDDCRPHGAAFFGVDCAEASACTAVGASVNAGGDPVGPPLAERWSGTGWRITPTPNPAAGAGWLNSVACASSTGCMAVGGSMSGTLAETWNGSSWTVVPTKTPLSPSGMRLTGVSCSSATACTAVGGSFDTDTLAERWDGTQWAIQQTPDLPGDPSDVILWSVDCPRPSPCIAVGKYALPSAPQLTLAEHWTG